MIRHEDFVECMLSKTCVRLEFYSKKDNGALVERVCAPLDFGPDLRANDQQSKYYFFDLDAGHPFKKPPEEILSLTPLDRSFEPASFVRWDLALHPWMLSRDWGSYS